MGKMINDTLLSRIEEYCDANSISDVGSFINEILLDKFMEIKWGHAVPKTEPVEKPVDDKEIEVEEKPIVKPNKPTNKKDFYGE